MLPWPALAALAFFAGSIPFGLLIAKAKGIDIRAHGSGNIGATNVGRVLGRPYFFLCFALDFLKGFLPTLLSGHHLGLLGRADLAPGQSLPWIAIIAAAVLGHVFSPWLGFKGGKGVATAAGALLGCFPILTIAGAGAFVVFFAALKITRYMSLSAMLASVALTPILAVLFALAPRLTLGEATLASALPFLAFGAALGLLVLWTHRSNIARLRAGTEPKFGERRPPT